MNRITNVTTPIQADNISVPAKNAVEDQIPFSKNTEEDQFTLSEGWPRKSDIERAVIDGLKILQKDFPKVQIFIGHGLEENMLRQMAAELGKGTHLVISDDWLEQISSSPEAFEKGKQVLTNILSQLSRNGGLPAQGAYVDVSGVRYWSVKSSEPEENTVEATQKQYEAMIRQLQEIQKQNKAAEKKSNSSSNKFKIKASNSSTSVSMAYARLAGASSKAQVRSAMSEARRSIGSLQMTASMGETMKERNKARAAISSLQKLLLRGSRKIRRLNEEELVRLRKKRAVKKKKEEQLRLELQKKRNARYMADRAILMEGHLDDVNNAFRFRKLRDDGWEEGTVYPPDITSGASSAALSEGIGAAGNLAAGNISAGGISASDVVMSAAVEVM